MKPIADKIMPSFYAEDLAYVHHVGFGDFAQRAGLFILQFFRSWGIFDGLVVDLGCGSGLWAKALTENGYSVVGVDNPSC